MDEVFNDVAVQFVKHDLGYGVFVYRPTGVIKGKYDSEMDIFQTVFGEMYDSVKNSNIDDTVNFYAPHSLEELKKIYKEQDEAEAMKKFYDEFLNYIYVGLCDPESYDVDLAAIELDSISDLIDLQSKDENEEHEQDKTLYFRFTEENLKDLMDLNSLKKIKEVLTTLIEQSKKIYEETEVEEEETQIDIPLDDEDEKKLKLSKTESKKMTLSNLRNTVLSQIVGQDQAVNEVTTTMIINENSKNPRHKAHILIAGPSGTGKTEMMNIISKQMNKPVFKADATAYTKEGFVGKSVYSMLRGLIAAADNDLKKAQNGILIIDEIDKKVGSKDESDISSTAVLYSLLKILDRDVIEIEAERERTIYFDTSNLTVVFMGAFTDLYKDKVVKKGIGFNNNIENNEEKEITINKEDLIKYGLPAEFLGRISKIVYTKELKEEDLVNILLNSEISPLKIEQEFFEDLGIKFKYTNDYVKELARKCLKHKTGARELKSEVQKTLEKAYEEVLNDPGKVKMLKLTKSTVNNNEKYCTKTV